MKHQVFSINILESFLHNKQIPDKLHVSNHGSDKKKKHYNHTFTDDFNIYESINDTTDQEYKNFHLQLELNNVNMFQ